MKWIDSSKQEFPTVLEQISNFENTRDNVYLGVIIEKHRKKQVENVVPLQLWLDEFHCEYWSVHSESEKVTPIKWALMPLTDC